MAGYTGTFKKKPAGITYDQICRDVQAGNLKPIYYLMGDESYYIDRVADFIVDTILKPEERDFNLITFFGADAAETCGYPSKYDYNRSKGDSGNIFNSSDTTEGE